MMRALLLVAGLAGVTGAAAAQGGPPADRLREQVVQRFTENYRTQAGLSDEQYGRLQATLRESWENRQAYQQQERAMIRGLERQMRPGVAANADSVTRLLNELFNIQVERAEYLRREQAVFAEFLSPIQRAQLVLALVRLEAQIEQIRQRGDRMAPGSRRLP